MVEVYTNDLKTMRAFYHDVLRFEILEDLEQYVEFKNEGVRFALSTMTVMYKATGDERFLEQKAGHTFGLAFRATDAAEVDITYDMLVAKGASPIKQAEDMPWGQRTAFFADPDGNIHEIFADL